MTDTTTGRATRFARPVRHIALATGVVLATCAVLAVWSGITLRQNDIRLAAMTARTVGTVVRPAADAAVVTWAGHTAVVPMTDGVPASGTRTEIAFDPAIPADAVIPGAAVLTDADRTRDGVLFAGLIAALVGLTDLALLVTRRPMAPRRALSVRRVVFRRGLIARTWLEVQGEWLPVYFEPVLLTLPAPVTVTAHGGRRVRVDLPDGTRLYPSGRARDTEPPGRRTDSPDLPDGNAAARAAKAGTWSRQLRVDSALLVSMPLVGLLWAYLDDGGITGWLGATALGCALALWWAAIRGSDPS